MKILMKILGKQKLLMQFQLLEILPKGREQEEHNTYNVNKSKQQEEQIGLYEACTGASAQYESKKLQKRVTHLYKQR